jgi:hypothetical protein
MRIQVECGDDRAANGPRRFVLGGETLEVAALVDRWYGDEANYFRVCVAGGDLYVLKHVRGYDRWELSSFTCRGSRGTTVGTGASGVLH